MDDLSAKPVAKIQARAEQSVLRACFRAVTESPSHCRLPVNFLLPLLFSQLHQKSFSDFFSPPLVGIYIFIYFTDECKASLKVKKMLNFTVPII